MHVAITGASTGIGAALARELARTGASLTLVARRRDRLEALAAELGVPCHVAAHDLADLERACDWVAPAEAALGPLDVLVNNAGAHVAAPMLELEPERAEALLRLDLLAPLRLSRHVGRAMVARGAGTIVDVTALAALVPLPGMAHYDAAKAGLAAASEALRVELRGTGVHVVTAYPGYIEGTDLSTEAAAAFEPNRAMRLLPRGTAPELAARVRRAIERREDRVLYPYPSVLAYWLSGPARWLAGRLAPSLRERRG